MNPLSGIEAVEREALADAVKYVYDYVTNADCSCEDPYGTCWYRMDDAERVETITRWVWERQAARLKAEREKIQKLLDPDPRLEVIEPYDFRLAAAMEQIRRLNLERERLEPFLEAAMEWGAWYDRNFKYDDDNQEWSEEEATMLRAYRALASDGEVKP